MEALQQVEHVEHGQAHGVLDRLLVRRQVGAFEDDRVDAGMTRHQIASSGHDLALDPASRSSVVPLPMKVLAKELSSGRPTKGVSIGAPTAAKCAGVRFRADAVSTPDLRLPASRLMCNSAEVATGTGEQAERSSR